MKLANRVLLVALAICVLSAVAFGQTPRGENDPRNLSPSVGTGGPEGGPTGLFTIYDGQTLRKGEFTFSFAFSNYDRDPGNVDITDWPASFNVGLNDHLELFFKMTAYRGIKVNNPQNLSSFYLPNTQGFFGTNLVGSGPAIILAPSGPNVGTMVRVRLCFVRRFVRIAWPPPIRWPFTIVPVSRLLLIRLREVGGRVLVWAQV